MEFYWHWIVILAVGVVGGFVNTVAGGASLICMPALYYLGLPATVANATNNFATTLQSLFAAIRYRQEGFGDLRLTVMLALPSVAGAAVGAFLVTSISEAVFKKVVGGLMLVALLVIFRTPSPSESGPSVVPSKGRRALVVILVGVLAVYGGFFGGGVGILLLPLIAVGFGVDYVTANGVKSSVVFLMNVTAMGIFVAHGLVRWVPACVLVVGMLFGAQLGVRMAVEGGERWVKRILVGVTAVAALVFLFP